MLRVIREVAPKYIVGENVFGLLNWNGGVVFNEVHSDLESEGYEVQAVVIPAAAVNAPHGRDRVWFVAYLTDPDRIGYRWGNKQSKSNQAKERKICKNEQQHRDGIWCEVEGCGWTATNPELNGLCDGNQTGHIRSKETTPCGKGREVTNAIETNGNESNATDTDSASSQCWYKQTTEKRKVKSGRIEPFCEHSSWEVFPTQPPICGRDDGIPTELDGITFSKWRNESIRGYGNAVVPQVILQIFKAIEQTRIKQNEKED